MLIFKIVNNLFYFYYLLIILRIFLTWIPSIDWHQQPFKFVSEITDVYLDIFKRFIPPIGGLDFSPIIAIFALEIIKDIILNILINFVR